MITRLEKIISAKNVLPDEQRSLFNDLFVKLKSDDQTRIERGWSIEEFSLKRDEMVRNLRSVAA